MCAKVGWCNTPSRVIIRGNGCIDRPDSDFLSGHALQVPASTESLPHRPEKLIAQIEESTCISSGRRWSGWKELCHKEYGHSAVNHSDDEAVTVGTVRQASHRKIRVANFFVSQGWTEKKG